MPQCTRRSCYLANAASLLPRRRPPLRISPGAFPSSLPPSQRCALPVCRPLVPSASAAAGPLAPRFVCRLLRRTQEDAWAAYASLSAPLCLPGGCPVRWQNYILLVRWRPAPEAPTRLGLSAVERDSCPLRPPALAHHSLVAMPPTTRSDALAEPPQLWSDARLTITTGFSRDPRDTRSESRPFRSLLCPVPLQQSSFRYA